jgi:membrane associated rhomboid family serine protease
MSPASQVTLSFPEFRGATRRLVLLNLGAYFLLLIIGLALPGQRDQLIQAVKFVPASFLHGSVWQPFTFSLVHEEIISTLLSLLGIWFLAGFLEMYRRSDWITGLYAVSVLGNAVTATAIYAAGHLIRFSVPSIELAGCGSALFGLMVAIGLLYGDVQFMLFPLPIQIKARYLAIIYVIINLAMLFGESWAGALSQLGAGLAAYLFIRTPAGSRGFIFFSESWYKLRNSFYRWKRHRAARKFEVYMKRQGRTVRLDGQGHPIDDDHNDKKRWN